MNDLFHAFVISEPLKLLGNLERWIAAGRAHATDRGFDPELLLALRHAPDMLPFSRQIQIICDAMKFQASRLSGKTAPTHADDEKTLAELEQRIQSVKSYLEGFALADFEGAATRKISTPMMRGKAMLGLDFARGFSNPNYLFHVATAYTLLRAAGVKLGKADFLGELEGLIDP
jgi:uncharacterized protein